MYIERELNTIVFQEGGLTQRLLRYLVQVLGGNSAPGRYRAANIDSCWLGFAKGGSPAKMWPAL